MRFGPPARGDVRRQVQKTISEFKDGTVGKEDTLTELMLIYDEVSEAGVGFKSKIGASQLEVFDSIRSSASGCCSWAPCRTITSLCSCCLGVSTCCGFLMVLCGIGYVIYVVIMVATGSYRK
jgi:hypothetical protein